MSDVEIITELNHRAARERELGERWDEIVRLRKRQKSLMKIAETACFSVACMLLGGTAVMLGFGLFRAAGFTVLPWPVDYRTGATQDDIVSFGIGNGFAELETGLREWVGLAAARILGHSRELVPREPRPAP